MKYNKRNDPQIGMAMGAGMNFTFPKPEPIKFEYPQTHLNSQQDEK
jgi:hypothetical protein